MRFILVQQTGETAHTQAANLADHSSSAIAPKRARGKARVAAILEAGAAVFAEKGYDGATMTEIAARAETAIGSLYRFFPTKGALADVMLANYKTQLMGGLDALIVTAAAPSPNPFTTATLAVALIDLMLSLRTSKDGVMAALDGRGDALALRIDIREGMRDRLSALLVGVTGVSPMRAHVCARALQHVLKTVTPLANEDEAIHDANGADSANTAQMDHQPHGVGPLTDEVQTITMLYLQHIFAEGASRSGSGR